MKGGDPGPVDWTRINYMLFWKAKFGSTNLNISTDISGRNVNDFTYYDDGYIGFAVDKSEFKVTSVDPAQAYEAVASVMGNDVFTSYTCPLRYGVHYEPSNHQVLLDYNYLKFYIPSISLMAPNMFKIVFGDDAISENVPFSQSLIYLYTLKRILRVTYSTSTTGNVQIVVYPVDDSGKIGNILSNSSSTGAPFVTYCAYNRNFGVLFGIPILYDYEIIGDTAKISKGKICKWFARNGLVDASIESGQGIYDWTVCFQSILSSGTPPDSVVPPGGGGGGGGGATDNPYEPGGDSGEGETPPGTFDDTSDPIPDSSLPSISVADTGFTRLYNPSLAQLQALAAYMWTDEGFFKTFWNHIKQYIEDPMQAIIGLNIVPVPVPEAGTEEVKVLYIPTGVTMTKAANQFVDVDCGTLELERYYGSALDQSPYTRVSCFLPFVGTVQLDTDEVMGTTLHIVYRVDICSGECVAKILVDGNCLYQYSGYCAINVPINSANFSQYIGSVMTLAGATAGGVVGGGVGAAAVALGANPMQQTGQSTSTVSVSNTQRNPVTGRQITTGTTSYTETKVNEKPITGASFAGLVAENVNNTVGQVMTSKERVERSGGFSGTSGYLGIRRPYLVIERPNMCMPTNYQQFNGFPAMITMVLGECTGFTQVQQVQLTGMTATNPEQAEILQFLKSGVIL